MIGNRHNGAVLLVACLALACGHASPPPEAAPPAPRPNIVFILADDLGYGDLGCYGQSMIATPEIDTLAEEGLRFTQVYAGSAVCAPSRSVLMTGQHTGHTRVRGNSCPVGGIEGVKGDRTLRRMHLTEDDVTIGHVLQGAGYRTGVVGKWHLGGFNPDATPLDRGFDEFSGTLIRTHADTGRNYWPVRWYVGRELVDVPENADRAERRFRTDIITDAAIDFMQRDRSRPFFLLVAYSSPHSPYTPPDLGPYADRDWPDAEIAYAAMIHHLDRSVGRLLAALDSLDLSDSTIVFFTSDNGPRWVHERGPDASFDFFDSNGPLAGYKRSLSEGGIRVPMLVRWPRQVPAGRTSDAVWTFADLLPTAAELAGVAAPHSIDGISVTSALGSPDRALPDRFLYWEIHQPEFRQAVRWRDWKALRSGLDGEIRLYNIVRDPGEKHDVAVQHPGLVAMIEVYLKRARSESPNWPT
jgi:arylsulfatase A-like enzyme